MFVKIETTNMRYVKKWDTHYTELNQILIILNLKN
jgi:hypothetical protein